MSGTDLYGADLRNANLSVANLGWTDAGWNPPINGANLSSADLRGANLHRARLQSADLSVSLLDGANLSEAMLGNANVMGASLYEANLSHADLSGTDLSSADLSHAILQEAQLSWANLEQANLEGTDLTRCTVPGIRGIPGYVSDTRQFDLVLTPKTVPPSNPMITIDGLETAQFAFFLFSRNEIWKAVERIKSRIVLLLGCFAEREASFVDVLKSELRRQDYVPMTVDFLRTQPETGAAWFSPSFRISRFVLVDITGAKKIAQETQRIGTADQDILIQPLVYLSAEDFAIPEELATSPSVLEIYRYQSMEDIQRDASELIARAEQKAQELAGR
ncbi:MAG: pentapeptide repeat-containing protein [Ktedonobacteraceae bacterium]